MAQIIVEDTQLQSAIDALVTRMGDLRQPMADIGEYMLLSTRDRFDGQKDTEGRSWTALSPDYARRKARSPKALKGILTYSGILRDTIAYRADAVSVTVGSNRIYAPIQQLGGTAGRNAKIPPRPFLGVSAADRTEIAAIVADWLS
jgi:phage virion morphogenesis protein